MQARDTSTFIEKNVMLENELTSEIKIVRMQFCYLHSNNQLNLTLSFKISNF